MLTKMNFFAAVVLLLLGCLELCQGQTRHHEVAKITDNLLSTYDKRVRPLGGNNGTDEGKPVVVSVNFLIRNIEQLDDHAHQWKVQLTFRQQWKDSRLKFDSSSTSGVQPNYINFDEEDAKKLWRPDLFFKNEKAAHFHDMMSRNQLIRVYHDGSVLYSTRITLTLACPMDLGQYPQDRQICQIEMASYGFTTEDIMFLWKEHSPVQVSSFIGLSGFTLEKYLTDYCTSKTNTGTYSCLRVKFLFVRNFSPYLKQMYLPVMMLVIVSWVGFWLNIKRALTARTLIVFGSLLALTGLVVFLNASMPSTSYTKRIDLFTVFSITFAFAALLEMATVYYLANCGCSQEEEEEGKIAEFAQFSKVVQVIRRLNLGHKLDMVSRVAFPVAYFFYVTFYAFRTSEKDI